MIKLLFIVQKSIKLQSVFKKVKQATAGLIIVLRSPNKSL